jgi:TolB-like protein
MPNKPSIAVLPFQNISGDPAQDYFTDGMVEEIITALSRFGELFVIARNSSFVYKGRQVDVKQVGHELGVRYVLEGSVRTAGSRVRITGQLIDTKTGAHIWADRFDGALEDVFDLQDNLTARVVGAIAPKIEHAEIERSQRKPTGSLDAYDYYLHGLAAMHEWSQKANDNALAHLHQAIKLDPNFAAAHGLAARCYVLRKTARWTRDNAAEAAEALRLAQRAIEIGADDAVALCTGGFALLDFALDFELADASIERALALNPNSAWAWLFSSWSKICKGEADEGIVRVQKAMRLSPQDPQLFSMRSAVACAHFVAGRYDEAIVTAEAAMVERPGFVFPDCIAAISAALVGRTAEANRFIEHILRIAPDLCVASAMDMIPFKRGEDSARWAEGLRRAGLPD